MRVFSRGLGIEGRFRADIQLRPYGGVDSKELEYGPGTTNAGCPSSLGFGVGDSRIPTCWLLLSTKSVKLAACPDLLSACKPSPNVADRWLLA